MDAVAWYRHGRSARPLAIFKQYRINNRTGPSFIEFNPFRRDNSIE